jgi:DNA-binding SARP family transcriptional activator
MDLIMATDNAVNSRGGLTVDVLGPLKVSVDGRPVELTTPRLRTLLVTLAMSPGKEVSLDHLETALWSADPPRNPRRSVQTYLARLRRMLGPSRISSATASYMLHVEPEHVDAFRFLRLLDAAAQEPNTTREREHLEEALALWRGIPLQDVDSHALNESESPRLLERYLAGLERRVDLDIAEAHYTVWCVVSGVR